MSNPDQLSPQDIESARARRLAAMNLQAIEGNPLSTDQVAMFEMFEAESWSHERRREYLLARVQRQAAE
jgi:hypothetical protein